MRIGILPPERGRSDASLYEVGTGCRNEKAGSLLAASLVALR
jgi:hypothetical protein